MLAQCAHETESDSASPFGMGLCLSIPVEGVLLYWFVAIAFPYFVWQSNVCRNLYVGTTWGRILFVVFFVEVTQPHSDNSQLVFLDRGLDVWDVPRETWWTVHNELHVKPD